MKIMHYIPVTIAAIGFAVTMSSCDEHIEFPDTAMKTCDILCTDGEIVRFADIESKGKTPIGVVSLPRQFLPGSSRKRLR